LGFTGGCFFLTYVVGRKIFSRSVAVVGAIAFLFLPIQVMFADAILLDVPLLFFVLLACWLLLSRPLDSFPKTIGLAAVLGMGMLVKWTYCIFVGPLFVYILARALQERRSDQAWLLRFFLLLFIPIFIALPWYLLHFQALLGDAYSNAVLVARDEGDPLGLTLEAFLYYLEIIVNEYFYLPLFVFVVIGVVRSVKKRLWFPLVVSGLVIVPAYVLFSLVGNKDPRYIYPVLPFFSLFIGYAVRKVGSLRQFVSLFFVFSFVGVQFLAGIFDLGLLSRKIAIPSLHRYVAFYEQCDPPACYFQLDTSWDTRVMGEFVLYNPFSYFGWLPARENWHLDDVALTVAAGDAVYVSLENHIFSHQELLLYYVAVQGKEIEVVATMNDASFVVCDDLACLNELYENYPENNCVFYEQPNATRLYACRLSNASLTN
jgi:4-amino-4-deoxy-L-arabinose transferase-like glycosyltransferase